MVISSTNVTDSSAIEPSEPVDEPPIRGYSPTNDKFSPGQPAANTLGIDFSKDQLSQKAHILDVATLSTHLGVDLSHGLTSNEAANRLAKDGPNKVEDIERISMLQIFLRQIANSLTVVLIAVMILSFAIHDHIEGGVVAAVISINIIVGFLQDYKAEQAILSLQALSSPECKVVRDSCIQTIKAEELVVGDVVQLAAGASVPADMRLFASMNLATDEALLTGESLPISKHYDKSLTEIDMPVAERSTMVYSGSMVTRGRGLGIVIAVAMLTEMGKIAALMENNKHHTSSDPHWKRLFFGFLQKAKHILGLIGSPMQVTLSKFALLLFALAILLAIIVFAVNLFDVHGEVLIYGICVAVAVIPESLIAVWTVTLAVGTQAMTRRHIVIRKLASLEAVGGVTNICSDKTGTLTQGKMIVRQANIQDGEVLMVYDTTNPFDPTSGGVITSENKPPASARESSPMYRFLDIVSLCNLATIQQVGDSTSDSHGSESQKQWTGVGEPTEIALQVFAMRFGHGKSEAMKKRSRVLLAEFGFDSSIKRMTMAYSTGEGKSIEFFTKGATEALLPILLCSNEKKAQINRQAEEMASQGLRVLCLGHKILPGVSEADLTRRPFAESDLSFAGLIGLYDPPRGETAEAIRTCKRAGIEVHMLTGDHIRTATAIAAEVGIVDRGIIDSPLPVHRAKIMAASVFDKLSDRELDQLEFLPKVLARCSPATKVRMVQALHRRKKFCIMTGDGINDAPALKLADIGIAMGLNGSDVAKQAADMVLANDDFASIVAAIEEGRRLFDNIQKFLLHLLTSNIAQVVLLLIGLAFKDDAGNSVFPLSPLEILWANLVTSSPLAIGLGLEQAVPDIMARPPRKGGVFTWSLIRDKMVYGVTMGSLCLAGFTSVVYGLNGGQLGNDCNQTYNDSCNVVYRARATTFAILSLTLLVTAWEVKDFNRSLFNMRVVQTSSDHPRRSKIFSIFPTLYQNRVLFWACISGFVVLFGLVYIPVINKTVLKHLGIGMEWGVVFGCLVTYVAVIEIWKAIKRRMATGPVVMSSPSRDQEWKDDSTETDTAMGSPETGSVV